ncbi:MAG: hypothetical protein ACFCVE_02340 [Phycisphaerae bacterium]
MLDDLKQLLAADPFLPFRIVLSNGHGYDVESPYQLALGESQLNYYYPRSDRWAVLRLNQVEALEILEGSAN